MFRHIFGTNYLSLRIISIESFNRLDSCRQHTNCVEYVIELYAFKQSDSLKLIEENTFVREVQSVKCRRIAKKITPERTLPTTIREKKRSCKMNLTEFHCEFTSDVIHAIIYLPILSRRGHLYLGGSINILQFKRMRKK